MSLSISISGLMIEGMRRALGRTPTSGEQARALDHWAEEIKSDLWQKSERHDILKTTGLSLLTEGTQVYSIPTDYETPISITVLDGSVRETAQSGTSTTIRLIASDSSASDGRIGREIVLISGQGAGQRRTITGWAAPVATVDSAWTNIPNATTGYMIVDTYRQQEGPMNEHTFNRFKDRTEREMPVRFMEYARQLWFHPVPDKTYPVLIQYWVNLPKLDVNSSTFNTVLPNWRSLFTQGFFVKTLSDEDDARATPELVVYRDMISEIVYKGMSMGQVEGQDY